MLGVNLDAARAHLGETVRIIHDLEGIRTTIIFDGRGEEIKMERPTSENTFSFLFTPSGVSADKIIEQFVAKAKTPESIIVVSRDNMIRETVSAFGACTLSPDALEDWIHACQRGQTESLKRIREKSDKLWKRSH